METKQLYLYDSYRRAFEARIQKIDNNQVVLDQTVFHPLTGGVAFDTGTLQNGGIQHTVLRVEINRETKEITHILDNSTGFKIDDKVKGEIY